jgi:hypothetical protein
MSIIKEEIIGADFRDKRLSKRYVKIVEQIQGNTDMSFPKAIPDDGSELKALYRFFTNERVTHKNILMPHRDNTVERCIKEDVVLFIQDTPYLNYSRHPYTVSMEYLLISPLHLYGYTLTSVNRCFNFSNRMKPSFIKGLRNT